MKILDACVMKPVKQNLGGCIVGTTNRRDLTEYAVEMGLCGVMYIPSFVKIVIGVQAILGFCLRNLRGCNIGTTAGRDL
jgi:hypothetical protein